MKLIARIFRQVFHIRAGVAQIGGPQNGSNSDSSGKYYD
jgi:hypothetical protein